MDHDWNNLLAGRSLKPAVIDHSLPGLFICPLTDSALLKLDGEQTAQYLQGQLTCDIDTLHRHNHLLSAHCDAKGKMWAILRTFIIEQSYLLLGHRDEVAASRTQLEKYGIFAKTTIADGNKQYLAIGIGGGDAPQWLAQQYQLDLKPDQHGWDIDAGKLLRLAPEQFVLILEHQACSTLLDDNADKLYQASLWALLEIKAGRCSLTETTINQYVPQMLNLHCLDAISFSKGCYSGQEMVARMKYLGKNKRATYLLTGHAQQMPEPGQELQLAIGANWRRGGSIINAVGSAEKFYLLAVLANDSDPHIQLRIKDDEQSGLCLSPLPYALNTDQ